ncbi:phosphodiester glycosidase family protein [Patescibacteria group bacterium]|nr:phosphodiester glycosidase family protein [Patescibacteria group bacterium]
MLKRLSIMVVAVLAVLGVGAVAFIKLDTPAAAEFTDAYLRPLLGANNVITLEKYYYNASDKAQQLAYSKNAVATNAAQDNSLGTATIYKNRLNLNPVAVNPALTPLSGEGVWKNRPLKLFPEETVMASTFVRPDPERPYALVNVAQIDIKALRLGLVAGKKEPGGPVGKPGPGVVPAEIVNNGRLIAAFDGGFQYRDGAYGMIVGETTYLPLKKDLGTLVAYDNGDLKIIDYEGQELGPGVAFVRQNCPILVLNGQLAVLDPKNKKLWGRTITASIFTWRSGLGLTKDGNLLFAVGNNLNADSLAEALKMAGAVNAIQLDINPYWVKFNIFNSQGGNNYLSEPLSTRLYDGKGQYLNGYNKDFFYLYK